jgi:hypothetical protein
LWIVAELFTRAIFLSDADLSQGLKVSSGDSAVDFVRRASRHSLRSFEAIMPDNQPGSKAPTRMR